MNKPIWRVTITKDLEPLWGMDDVYEAVGDDPVAFQGAAIELLHEDIPYLLEGATFRVERIEAMP
jgi:hypothetical protein